MVVEVYVAGMDRTASGVQGAQGSEPGDDFGLGADGDNFAAPDGDCAVGMLGVVGVHGDDIGAADKQVTSLGGVFVEVWHGFSRP